MPIVSILRKLGILRFGIKTYRYDSGRDMPAESLLDDVYDAEKDLISVQDFRHKNKTEHGHTEAEHPQGACHHCGKMQQPGDKFCRHCGGKLERLIRVGPE